VWALKALHAFQSDGVLNVVRPLVRDDEGGEEFVLLPDLLQLGFL